MTRKLSTLLLLSAVVAACDDTTGPADLSDAIVADLVLVAADATVEEVTLWSEPAGFDAGLPAIQLASAVAPGGRGGFGGPGSGTRVITFYDVDGLEQDAYDELLTASIHVVHDTEGSIQRGAFSAEISRTRDMTVTGLEGEETTRTWNGGGSSSMARAGVMEDGTERSHTAESEFTFTDVVVPVPGSESPYPLSGTITRSIVAEWTTADGTMTREVEMTITFDGTSIAQAVVNGEVVEIDLTAREGRIPFRRR